MSDQYFAQSVARALRGFVALSLGLSSVAFGQISISNGGMASTLHAIPMPPGIAGMVPSVGLEYSDGGQSGPVGFGWSISGFSTVTRCPSSRSVDGLMAAMLMVPTDRLCLDGQRLIQTNEAGVPLTTQVNDAQGLSSGYREFRTEKDSYARIRAYGSADGSAAKGPAYFKVWTKSGQVYHYGPATGANAHAASAVYASYLQEGQTNERVATWAVSRITDRVGNYIDYEYETRTVDWGSGPSSGVTPGLEWNLKEIRYTGTPTQLPHNKIAFVYTDRPSTADPSHDRAETYFLGHKRVAVRLLTHVRTSVNAVGTAVPVRALKLAYQRSTISGRSLLSSITECVGSDESRCLPPTRYAYSGTSPGPTAPAVAFASSTAFAGTLMRNLNMLDTSGSTVGVLTGDFDGDGRTDVLRWASTPSLSQLWRSMGGGGFEKQTNFNLTGSEHVLFDTNGCRYSIVADFDGDGLSDILRVAIAACASGGNVLFRSVGNGTFTALPLPSGLSLEQSSPIYNIVSDYCMVPQRSGFSSERQPRRPPPIIDDYAATDTGSRSLPSRAQSRTPRTTGLSGPCMRYTRSEAARFYIMDVDADGIVDIVTTRLPGYSWNSGLGPIPSEQELCLGYGYPPHTGTCTKVFKGNGSGGFNEITGLSVAWETLYSDPAEGRYSLNPYWRLPTQADLNADGLMDIWSEYTGRWRSLGNGDFASSPGQSPSSVCGLAIDFNGDGRADCVFPNISVGSQSLTLSFGASASPPLTQFNVDDPLLAFDAQQRQTVGAIVEDFNGDGRQDILRWGPTNADHQIFFSRGDGSFTKVPATGLNDRGALQAADGSRAIVLGDFLGDGTLQVLRLKSSPPSSGGGDEDTNILLVRSGAMGPIDLLTRVTTPNGLFAEVGNRVPLTLPLANGGAYVSDRGTPSQGAGSIVDIQPPMYVARSVSRQTGSGTLHSWFQYKGLKAERGGRGVLGYREFQQADPGADGLSTVTKVQEHLLQHPYNGLARSVRTYLSGAGQVPGELLSSTVNTYCDRSSAADPDSATDAIPCATAAKVTRSYLRKSVDAANELQFGPSGAAPVANAVLPVITTTNTFNDFGDGTQVVVKTEALLAGALRTHTKTTTNEICNPGSSLPGGGACPNNISGDNWLLGRNTRAVSNSAVQDLFGQLGASYGWRPLANAIVGSPPAGGGPAINPGTLAAIIQLILED